MIGKPQQSGSLEIRDGDTDAWREMLVSGIPQLYGMFVRHGINPGLAEELVQKTVFDAVRGRNSFDPARGAARQWLMGIAKNNLAMEMRRRAKAPILDGDVADYIETVDSKLLPDEVLERKETAEIVRKAMSGLPDKEQDVLKAKYIQNLSARSIAEAMGITEKAVHSLLYRARNSLRNKLKTIAPLYARGKDHEK